MKKILFLFFILSSFLVASPSNAQQKKFYYYPSANVYYDISGKQYVYFDNGTWTQVNTLPANIKLVNTRRVIVYHPNREIWMVNSDHVKKYKLVKVNPGKKKGHYKH
jgi:uncharacterized membrane protein YeiB